MAHRLNIETLLFLMLASSAIFMLRGEISAFASARASSNDPVHFLDELPKVPFSLQAVEQVLLLCDSVMAVHMVGLQPRQRRQTTAKTCMTFVDQVIAEMPTHSFAHLIAARATDRANAQATHLAASAKLAPFEGWLAERRFVLGMNKGGPRSDLGVQFIEFSACGRIVCANAAASFPDSSQDEKEMAEANCDFGFDRDRCACPLPCRQQSSGDVVDLGGNNWCCRGDYLRVFI